MLFILFRNYVVQHLLSQKIPGVTEQLLGHLRYRFTGMSTNKYASNVVEKFLTEAGEEHSTIIIMELINSPDAAGLLFDPFANYVIQRALSVSRVILYLINSFHCKASTHDYVYYHCIPFKFFFFCYGNGCLSILAERQSWFPCLAILQWTLVF